MWLELFLKNLPRVSYEKYRRESPGRIFAEIMRKGRRGEGIYAPIGLTHKLRPASALRLGDFTVVL
jgi:hypothetical protein